MKKVILRTIVILFFLLVSLMTVLSTIGFKTDRFNQLISKRILENNKNFSLKLEKIKFKFDIKNFNLFLETKNPEVNYKNLIIPIKEVKAYLDFISLLKSKPKINMINISSKELDINQLKRILSKTKPSSLNSLVTNRRNNGKIVLNFNAKQVNIVATNDAILDIQYDGDIIPIENRGNDVNPDGTVIISEPRLYNIIELEEEGPHEIIIDVKSSGFEIFTFTFG